MCQLFWEMARELVWKVPIAGILALIPPRSTHPDWLVHFPYSIGIDPLIKSRLKWDILKAIVYNPDLALFVTSF